MMPRFLHLDTIPSTMDAARDLLLSGRVQLTPTGRLNPQGVTAQEQTAGRGQRGRNWFAPHGESLCATFYFRHGMADLRSAGHVSLLAGVAAANTLRAACRHSPAPLPSVSLKWPNDLLLNDKKVGGILVELVQTPSAGWVALIGVGINVRVRAFPSELAGSATSLWLEGVQECPSLWLADHIAPALDRQAANFNREGLAGILRRWRAYDRTPGRRYRMERDGVAVEGIAEGIDDAGALLLRADDGRLLPTLSASSLREISAKPRLDV